MGKTKPIALRRIRQAELTAFQKASAKVDSLKRALAQAEAELESVEGNIKTEIEQGWPVEDGEWNVRIDVKERRAPAWKTVVLERLGQQVVDQVIANCIPSVTRKLVVVRSIA